MFRTWMGSLRTRWHGHSDHQAARDICGQVIYASWHENLLLFSYALRHRGIQVMVSRHDDGEIIARILKRLGFSTVRGSTTRGGALALRRMIQNVGRVDFGVTPDGPRGPRREVQPGVILLASLSGLPIVPLVVAYQHFWRNRSWDRTIIPRPGTRVVARTLPAVVVPRGARPGSEPFRAGAHALETALTEGDRRNQEEFDELYRGGQRRV